jgi:hypothetical protein
VPLCVCAVHQSVVSELLFWHKIHQWILLIHPLVYTNMIGLIVLRSTEWVRKLLRSVYLLVEKRKHRSHKTQGFQDQYGFENVLGPMLASDPSINRKHLYVWPTARLNILSLSHHHSTEKCRTCCLCSLCACVHTCVSVWLFTGRCLVL